MFVNKKDYENIKRYATLFADHEELKAKADKLVKKVRSEIKILKTAELEGSALGLLLALQKYEESDD